MRSIAAASTFAIVNEARDRFGARSPRGDRGSGDADGRPARIARLLERARVLPATALVIAFLLTAPAAATATNSGIAGTVLSNGLPVKGARLFLYPVNVESPLERVETDSSGKFRFESGPGKFNLFVSGPPESNLLSYWYNTKRSKQEAEVIEVGSAEDTHVGVSMEGALTVSGTLVDAHTGQHLGAGDGVELTQLDGLTLVATAGTAENGTFSLGGLYPGEYLLRASAAGYGPYTYYQLRYSSADANRVSAGASGLTLLMRRGGLLEGRVTEVGTGIALNGVSVVARNGTTGETVGTASSSSGGTYAMELPGGLSYALEFEDSPFVTQFYSGKLGFECADVVAVAEKATVRGINVAMTKTGSGLTSCSAPTVKGVEPNEGPLSGGNSVGITGTRLTGATAVRFGSTEAASFKVNSATSITATAPAGAGTVDVTVTSPEGTSGTGVADRYTYVPAPAVTKVKPNSGPAGGGTAVTITGANFAGAKEVRFGATSVGFTVSSPTTITASAPAAAAGTVDVRVTGPGGTSAVVTGDRFKSTPTITGLSPGGGSIAGGTSVTVTGTGFALGTAASVFKFGTTKPKSVNCTASTECTIVSPAHAAGSVEVKVTVNKVPDPKTGVATFTFS